jgi:predicted anti-sigma-YlaC factor YlaD
MNCQEIEKLMLLEQSGEGTPEDAGTIEQHVASCTACQRYRDELAAILSLAEAAEPSDGPAPGVIAAIEEEAARRATRVIRFPRPALQWLAYAAAAALLVGGWLLLTRNAERVNDPTRMVHQGAQPEGNPMSSMETAADVSVLVAMLADETDSDMVEDIEMAEDREQAIKVLARQLLRLQGINTDEDLLADDLFQPDLSAFPPTHVSAPVTS